jgi:hypothetical protein
MSGAKKDVAITRLLRDNGLFLDKRSFVGHGLDMIPHLFLKGNDIGPQRDRVWLRSGQKCKSCKARLGWVADDSYSDWEMDHVQGGNVGRCDCLHNLQSLCVNCHRNKHVKPQWTKKKQQAIADFEKLYDKEAT